MDLRSILNTDAAAARANTVPALHSTPQSSPQSMTRPLPPQIYPTRQASLPTYPNFPPPQPPYTPHPATAGPYPRHRSVSVSPKTQVTSLSIPPTTTRSSDPEPIQNPTPVSSLDQPIDMGPHRISTAPSGPLHESLPSEYTTSSIITSSPQPPSRKRSISTIDQQETEDLQRKRLRRDPPRWAQRADWDNLQVDVERIVQEVIRARQARARTSQTPRMKSKHISVDRSPAPPPIAPPPPNGLPLRDAIPLRPEPTITGFEPYYEFDRRIADFLFDTVVLGPDLGGQPSHGGPRAVFEIEAKIGTLLSRDDGMRVALPVFTETILRPGEIATRFESTMSTLQHRNMNNFLNLETKKSQLPPRIPIHYRHSVEVDSFHPLSAAAFQELPPMARELLSMRKHAPKIRVTRDSKTQQVTAKIVKARIADLDIFCPAQVFDVRISINVEMRYDGPIDALVDRSDALNGANGNPGSQPPRQKNRVSYEHQGVRIDLTQVGDPQNPRGPCSHELEVEVDAEEVRRQGQLAQQEMENGFEPLVKRFLDNVRVLLRAGSTPTK